MNSTKYFLIYSTFLIGRDKEMQEHETTITLPLNIGDLKRSAEKHFKLNNLEGRIFRLIKVIKREESHILGLDLDYHD